MCRNYYDNKIISLIEATTIIIVNETTVQISAIWQVSLSLLTEYNAVSNYIRPPMWEKKRNGNYINRNRDHCGNTVCISSCYYCRCIIIISSSRIRQENALHLKLLVIGRCIAESAVHLTRTRRRRSATCAATTKTGCTCKLNYSREPGST